MEKVTRASIRRERLFRWWAECSIDSGRYKAVVGPFWRRGLAQTAADELAKLQAAYEYQTKGLRMALVAERKKSRGT